MAPRKKSSASSSTSKKSNQNHQPSQPSKFGIEHFFERHTQNTAAASSTSQNPRNLKTSHPVNSSQNTPPPSLPVDAAIIDDTADDVYEVSPDTSKQSNFKRFKFSPGMLIKQTQDDGGDEVTWKISPVNERLLAVTKRLPGTIGALADASKLNGSNIRQCSQKQSSLCSEGKLEKWLSSPNLKPSERSLLFSKEVPLRVIDPNREVEVHRSSGNANDQTSASTVNQQSPFRTPPSVQYCSDEAPNGIVCKGAFDQQGSRLHRKALIELLDQVEDVIAVEESVSCNPVRNSFKSKDVIAVEESVSSNPVRNSFKAKDKHCGNITIESNPQVEVSERIDSGFSDLFFLVLEVSEKHMVADSSSAQCPIKVLRLLNEQSGEERALHLHDEWFYSIIGPGDTINVIGEFDEQGKCVVDHENNFVIVHPDILLSGTRVAASFSCPRRTVLDERLKCNEHSTAALVGIMLHQIFQAGLVREHPTKDFLEEYARGVLHKNIESMYACGVNENDMHKTLIEAIPRLLNWLICFKDTQESKAPTVDFGSKAEQKKVNIIEVMDIEEMAWTPKYGLKGMIDASILVKTNSTIDGSEEKIMPLEFKSGKGTTGQSFMEHCAQVVLYTLLMSERYLKRIDSGLLYYLHTDQTQGIMVQRSDMVGLIIRRNELANDILTASTAQKLPPMLQNPNMCKSCRHLSVCVIYHKAHGGNRDSSGLADMFDSHVEHLTTVHCDFLRHWDRLIDLEANQTLTAKKEIWHSHKQKSERSANGLSSIILDVSNELSRNKSPKDGRYIYRFVRQDVPFKDPKAHGETLNASTWRDNLDVLDCTLRSGDYVILGTDSGRVAVASGVIADIDRFYVSVSFSRRLRLPESSPSSETGDLLKEVWRIDKDELTTSYAIMRFNLTQLFVHQSSQLRKMIVDLEVPRFDSGAIFSQDPAISYIRSEKNLNDDQRRAILKILTAKDYALILGMPGTGKTSTMVHAVKALLMRGASILLTSYTNSAVDNLLIKLKAQRAHTWDLVDLPTRKTTLLWKMDGIESEDAFTLIAKGIDFVRIGRYEAVHEEVRGHCFSASDTCSVEDIKQRLEQVKVVAVTCLGITHPLLAKKRFDLCIMDEAGQTTLPVSLGPLMFASTFVLVGDHYQLPPLVQSTEARENGMGISLFCRLSEAHPEAISPLQCQYRMCAGIMELSNALIYGNRLRCGSSEVANAKLRFSSAKSSTSWLKEVFDSNRSVVLINTDALPALETKDHKTVNNPTEAYIVAEITEELVKRGVIGEDIGIITPYNSQVNLIRRVLSTASVEIHTIDKYQGRDKDCILLSFVRSTENSRGCSSSLLGDWHRINVALTRAKKKLIMVGSCRTLSKVPLLKLLIEKVDEQSGILNVSKKDFHHFGELKRCSQDH